MSESIVWQPSQSAQSESRLAEFMQRVGVDSYEALVEWTEAEPERFWDEAIRYLDIRFEVPYERVRDTSKGLPWTEWCVGGQTNAVLSLLERYRGTDTYTREAIRWESESGDRRQWTYQELDQETNRLAGGLRSLGLEPGDAVGIFMPMVPEVTAAFLAIQHIGAIAVPLFSGFGADAIATRLNDGEVKVVLTVDATKRRGTTVAMKSTLDQALMRNDTVRHVVVLDCYQHEIDWHDGTDRWWADIVAGQPDRLAPEIVPADTPSVLVYTSGSTGKPKGVVLTHCSYPVKMGVDLVLTMDLKSTDRLLWMSDFGWVVGPMQLTAALLAGACLVMAEGVPDFPEQGRMWRLIEDHRVTYLGIAPTSVRTLMRYGTEVVGKYDLSSLRITASTGEPWTEEAWHWFFDHVCQRKVPIFNITGGTEISGGILVSHFFNGLKPCSFNGPALGVAADIVDEHGQPVETGQVGELVLRDASIGLSRGVWRDPDRYIETYWGMFGNLWRQGDWARRDEDGMWYVEGRSDDTLKVAGKRTGPAEIEGLVMATGKISEAAAVGIPDPVSGQAVLLAMVPAPGIEPDAALEAEIAEAVMAGQGKPFRPARQVFVTDLPKTRNMKILRRVVKSVFTGDPPGDLTALFNPESIAELERNLSAQAHP